MGKKILYVLPSYNMYGGTPKKTLDLIKYSSNDCYLYVWTNSYAEEFKEKFVNSGAIIYEGLYGRNIFKHITSLLKIIDENNIQIIQSQFFFGELLVGIIKKLRPKVKVIIAFVGSSSPSLLKRIVLKSFYHNIDAFVYISEYVKREKVNVYPKLSTTNGVVIYNGTNIPKTNNSTYIKSKNDFTLLSVSGLTKIKNIQVLIDSMEILLKKNHSSVKFLVAGDGPEMKNYQQQILEKKLENNFKLLGYKKNIGDLLNQVDVFVHPCYIEGFGIAVAEAMITEKPIIVSNSGALPELIENEKTGLAVAPFNPEEWANAIIKLKENPSFAATLAKNSKNHAEKEFSVIKFVSNYNKLYQNILN